MALKDGIIIDWSKVVCIKYEEKQCSGIYWYVVYFVGGHDYMTRDKETGRALLNEFKSHLAERHRMKEGGPFR